MPTHHHPRVPWIVCALAWTGCTRAPDGHVPRPPTTDAPVSAPAALQSLAVAGAVLRPAFDPAIRAYAVRTEDAAAPLTVDAVPADPEAPVWVDVATIDDAPPVPLEAAGPLVDGDRIEVTVTPADGGPPETTVVVALPSDFPEVTDTRTGYGTPSSADLYLGTLTGEAGATDPEVSKYAMILDPHGVPIWWRSYLVPVYDFRRGDAGLLTFVGVNEAVLLDAATRVEVGRTGARPFKGRPLQIDVHELFQQADGTLLVLGTYAEPRDLSPYGGGAGMQIVHHVIQEIAPNGSVVFAWSTDGAVDLDRVPVWTWDPILEGWDYCHVNAVSYDPDDGNLIVSMRILSQVLKVARAPTLADGHSYMTGEVMWRLGGPDSEFTFVDDPRLDGWIGFAGQHSARAIGGGELLVFDNAQWREAPPSDRFEREVPQIPTGQPRYVAYALDTARRTATRIDEHLLDTPSDPIRAGGSVQRLANGHTLIGWGDRSADPGYPSVTELDQTGAVVRTVTLASTVDEGGPWSYRAWMFGGGDDSTLP